jgi:cysteinyl-tRNA synthetase
MMTEYLRLLGMKVTYVRNYTDIDDKIIVQAREAGITPLALADQRIAATDELMARILTRDADVKPRVSEYIGDIIDFISGLIAEGFAYTADGDVYFDVAKDPGYGKLSNRNTKDMLNNVRIDANDSKQSGLDFALWKGVAADEFGFDSPFGRGRPGWHIECSTMIKAILGDTIDIHGGGKDLIFPHHENEIAQSECHNHCDLARFWVHNGLITVGAQKMSKSLNNFITVRQLLDEYDAEVVRFLLLSNHYASPLEVNKDLLTTAEKHMYGFYRELDGMRQLVAEEDVAAVDLTKSEMLKGFFAAMDNDFNVSLFLADLFGIFAEYAKLKGDAKKAKAAEILAVLRYVYLSVGLFNKDVGVFVATIKEKHLRQLGLTEEYIESKIAERKQAKANKDYAKADAIRNELLSQGITLMDTPSGTQFDVF